MQRYLIRDRLTVGTENENRVLSANRRDSPVLLIADFHQHIAHRLINGHHWTWQRILQAHHRRRCYRAAEGDAPGPSRRIQRRR